MGYKPRICKECGSKFIPSSPRQLYCKNDHYRPCPICGKLVKAVYLNEPAKCCSSMCSAELAKRSGSIRNCEICGKEFKTFGTQKYCNGPHYRPCPVCNKPVEYHRKSDPVQCCSTKCKSELYRSTNLSKDHICEICGKVFTSPGSKVKYCEGPHYRPCPICGERVKFSYIGEPMRGCSLKCSEELRKRTSLKIYGVEYPAQTDAARSHLREVATDPEYIENKKLTCMEKYGVDNPSKSSLVREKISKTLRTDAYRNKFKSTMQDRYGVDYAMQSKTLLRKHSDGCMEKHGVRYPCLLQQCRSAALHTVSKVNLSFSSLLSQHGIDHGMELNIDRYSYDIYIKTSKIVIEINPTYTHNSVRSRWESCGKSIDYHLKKREAAVRNGYRCIHVFDWDDPYKIVSMLESHDIIYARKCEIVILSQNDVKDFVTKYHLQGSCKGQSVAYGLMYNGELVQVMSFGKPRYNKNYEWELLRLCSHSKYRVVGGANRLFRRFLIDHNPSSIISYCDLAKFSGDVYINLGFTLDHTTQPNKIWSMGVQHITNNLLLQRGYDQLFDTNYGRGTSNEDLMLQNGWLPVYDCGQGVYVWNK